MILVDYSGSAVASILAFQKELKQDDAKVKDLIRHVVLSTLVSYKKRFGAKYGKMVICCDSRHYWRRDVFANYKSKRKKARDDSGLPWKMIFDTMSEIRDDLEKYFPYHVILVDGAEADDCIAAMAKWTQENNFKQEGLFLEPEPTLIVASDHDMGQLQKFKNIRQWSPMAKKFIDIGTKDMNEGPIIHIVKGDSGDSVPNIFSDDNVFIEERRQKPVSATRLEEFIEKGIDACRNDAERRNWHRNEKLVSFDFIPKEIEETIIKVYNSQNPKTDKMGIMNYFIKNRCRLLLDSIEDF